PDNVVVAAHGYLAPDVVMPSSLNYAALDEAVARSANGKKLIYVKQEDEVKALFEALHNPKEREGLVVDVVSDLVLLGWLDLKDDKVVRVWTKCYPLQPTRESQAVDDFESDANNFGIYTTAGGITAVRLGPEPHELGTAEARLLEQYQKTLLEGKTL